MSLSVKTKAFALLLVVPLVVFGLMAVLLFSSQFSRGMADARAILALKASSMGDSVRLELGRSFEFLRTTAANPLTARVVSRMGAHPSGFDNDDFKDLREFGELKDFLDASIRGTTIDLAYVGSPLSSGLILGRDVQLAEGFDVRKRDYYKAAMANPGKPVISEPRVSAEVSAEPIIVITGARSVHDAAGLAVGIAAFNYRLTPIINLLRSQMESYDVAITFFDTEGGYLLWRPEGVKDYFFDPKDKRPLDALLEAYGYAAGKPETEALTKAVLEEDAHFFEGRGADGALMIQALRIPDSRWGILVEFPKASVVSSVRASIMPSLGIVFSLFAVAQLLIFYALNRSVIVPLSRVGSNLEALSQGDADLTISLPAHDRDEIGRLALSFNHFVEKLRFLMRDLRIAMEGVERVKQNLSSSTEETSASIEEISANIASIRKQMDALDASIAENGATVKTITDGVMRVDDQIMSQSAMVEESTAAITEMIASLGSVNAIAQNKGRTTKILAEVAADGKEKIEQTAAAFRTVVNDIQLIQEMADAINGIASQTNLLSMNAAIEAAHAGDAGRGFAVVAEEIRKLADSAGQSSHSIAGFIKDIAAAVKETESNVERTSDAFERIAQEVESTVGAFTEIEQSVSELNIGGKQILESTNQINEVTVQIRESSRLIKEGTKDILKSASTMKDVSDSVTTGMAEASGGASEIVSSVHLLLAEAQELKTIVDELRSKFGRFKTE